MSYANGSTESEPERPNVVRLSVEPVPERKRPRATAQAPISESSSPQPQIIPADPEPVAAPPASPPVPVRTEADYLIAAFKALGMILSARALLALSLCGAFILAMTAMTKGGWMGLVALSLYGLCTVAPLAWLESRRNA